MIKRRFWGLFNSCRKKKDTRESRRINSLRLSNDVKSIFTTKITSSEIAAINLSTQSPMHFLNFETNTEMKQPSALVDVTSAGDYDFMHGDRNVITNKDNYGDRASQLVSTLQESRESISDDTIEQVWTDNLSIGVASRNVDSLSPVKSESNTPEINQQQSRDQFKLLNDQHSQEYDIFSQSPKLQDYTHKDSVSNATDRLQQQSRITRCIPQTLAIISMKQPYPRREYHTWKISEIENDIKCDDFFTSDIRGVQRGQSARYGLSRFDGLTCSGSSGNQGSSLLCLPSVPHRDFSSKSCIMIQNSVPKIETSRKDLFGSPRHAHPGVLKF